MAYRRIRRIRRRVRRSRRRGVRRLVIGNRW
jgi:hypothetical protein